MTRPRDLLHLILYALVQFYLIACQPDQTAPLLASVSSSLPAALSPTPSITPIPSPDENHLPGETWTRPLDGAVMVYVLSGKFMMGSDSSAMAAARKLCREYTGETAVAVCTRAAFANEYPAHPVAVTGFWLDRTEVTNGQYRSCVDAGACTQPVESGSYYRTSYYSDPAYTDYPVIWVTQGQAANYCAWAGARLPTEAEWEYAARGPESTIFPWGDEFDGTRLNYCDRNCDAGPHDPSVDDGYADTAPVGSYPAGASWVGALDMAGNVREWVADWSGMYLPGLQADPVGPETGEGHIPRGGAWLDKPDDVRSANRGENSIDYSRHKVGFRCALSASLLAAP